MTDQMYLFAEPGRIYKAVSNQILVCAPTTKAVGSIYVTKLEPTASVVGLLQNRGCSGF
jgi:hypothetical protein